MEESQKKIKCFKITTPDGGGWLIDETLTEILESEVGYEYHVEVIEMTREELDALPEFDGF